MSNPNEIIVTIKQQECCTKTLSDIKHVLETGKLIQGVLKIAPFALLFGLKLKPSAVSTISFFRRDMNEMSKTVAAANKISKAKCRQLCQFHQLKHRGGPEKIFWQELEKTFI
ncbi:MAG: hypothetical protein AB8B79_10300 [Granulosicoccus sp.]